MGRSGGKNFFYPILFSRKILGCRKCVETSTGMTVLWHNWKVLRLAVLRPAGLRAEYFTTSGFYKRRTSRPECFTSGELYDQRVLQAENFTTSGFYERRTLRPVDDDRRVLEERKLHCPQHHLNNTAVYSKLHHLANRCGQCKRKIFTQKNKVRGRLSFITSTIFFANF